MPDENDVTNVTDDQDTVESQVEETLPEQSEATETEVTDESSTDEAVEDTKEESDFDIEDYWNQRYNPQNPPTQEQVATIEERLAKIPSDEDGNADPAAVAQVFKDFQTEVLNQAANIAQSTSIGFTQEQAEQKKLIESFPKVKTDREFAEDVFDKRDAAALRGESITLVQAAERLTRREASIRKDAATKAVKTTTVQAAAHLESSNVKGNTNSSSKQQLYQTATQGSGQEAKEASAALLKDAISAMFPKER